MTTGVSPHIYTHLGIGNTPFVVGTPVSDYFNTSDAYTLIPNLRSISVLQRPRSKSTFKVWGSPVMAVKDEQAEPSLLSVVSNLDTGAWSSGSPLPNIWVRSTPHVFRVMMSSVPVSETTTAGFVGSSFFFLGVPDRWAVTPRLDDASTLDLSAFVVSQFSPSFTISTPNIVDGLITGSWNDSGVWLDSGVWNDG
jgi:hypothetical protein